MKTVLKTVGGQAVGILLYSLLILSTSLLMLASPYIGIGMYVLAPLAVLFFISLYTILLIEDLAEEETFELHIEEYIKKASINTTATFVIGLIIQFLMETQTGILSHDPIETSIFIIYLAYVVPYGVIGLKSYEETFNKLGLSKDVLKGYIAMLMVLLMSIFIITSFTKIAFILSGILVVATILLTYQVTNIHNKEQNDLTNTVDLEYTEDES